jgi:hypothetical protein
MPSSCHVSNQSLVLYHEKRNAAAMGTRSDTNERITLAVDRREKIAPRNFN